MNHRKIVVTQPVHEEVLRKLQAEGEVIMNPGPDPWSPSQLREYLVDADAMMAFMTDSVTKESLLNAPRLKTISCALKGYDNFDLRACAQAGVSVTFVPDLLTEPTAELAIGLAIAAGRNVLQGDAATRAGYSGWRPALYGTGLHGSVASVIGLGKVGQAILARLAGFGCARLLGVDPSVRLDQVELVTLDEAVSTSDYVFLAVPLDSDTRHLVDSRMLQLSKKGQILVNVGRGSVVDERAVVDALANEQLGAYAADVYEMEDWLLPDRPREIHPGLTNNARTVLTPHIGSAVRRVRFEIEMRAAENLVRSLRGESLSDVAVEASAAA